MKKTIACFLLVSVLLAVSLIPSAADGEKRGVNMAFIVNSESVSGCADNASLFDRLIDAAILSGVKITVLFDADIKYNADCASAMMKAFAADMPIGIYDGGRNGPDERILSALTYQKYVVKSASRLVGTSSNNSKLYGEEFCLYRIDIIVPNAALLERLRTTDAGSVNFAMRIDGEMITVAENFIGGSAEYGLYIITPTEYGNYVGNAEG